MISNDVQLKYAAFFGAAALAISQSDRDVTDPKLWALAVAAGAASLVALLRPPAPPSPRPPALGGDRGRG